MAQWSERTSKPFGCVSLVLSPMFFVMAAISTVQSLTAYYLQLALFWAASAALLVCGLGALLGARWAARGPLMLGALVSIYLSGSGVLIAVFTFRGLLVPGQAGAAAPSLFAAGLAIAGIVAWYVARRFDRRRGGQSGSAA